MAEEVEGSGQLGSRGAKLEAAEEQLKVGWQAGGRGGGGGRGGAAQGGGAGMGQNHKLGAPRGWV